jgi:hypothetical protein
MWNDVDYLPMAKPIAIKPFGEPLNAIVTVIIQYELWGVVFKLDSDLSPFKGLKIDSKIGWTGKEAQAEVYTAMINFVNV